MQDLADHIKRYMEANNLSQNKLAKRAKISQPTVWRAINRKPLRHGGARAKLFTLIGINELDGLSTQTDPRKRVLAAFDKVWNQTEAQADAIIRVIDALGDLSQLSRSLKKEIGHDRK
jgi:transcriptional regulator with XRE-family HTH domain